MVDPDGALNENAVRTAHGGGHSAEKVEGIDDETVDESTSILEELAAEFDDLDPEG
ncbi:hypothetical protein ACNS7O_07575 [Haloferacaceae archaeon DSL9]